jgi:hypothetical protein
VRNGENAQSDAQSDDADGEMGTRSIIHGESRRGRLSRGWPTAQKQPCGKKRLPIACDEDMDAMGMGWGGYC